MPYDPWSKSTKNTLVSNLTAIGTRNQPENWAKTFSIGAQVVCSANLFSKYTYLYHYSKTVYVPARIHSMSAPYFLCPPRIGDPEPRPLPLVYLMADLGIWRLYSTRPSAVMRGNCLLERRAWTALRTPAPRSKWLSSSSIDLIRGAALVGPIKAARMATHSWLAWRTLFFGSTNVGTTVAAILCKKKQQQDERKCQVQIF